MLNRLVYSSLLFLCLSSFSLYAKFDLVICAIFQNEAFFLREWIEFHKLVGVQHFYLYNNLSTDNYLQILSPYIEAGEVDLFDWPVETKNQNEYLTYLQLPAYNHALSLIKETARWAAFIDLDEFLFPVYHGDLPSLLEGYSAFGALAVNGQVFGTSGIDRLKDKELIIENLLLRAPDHWGVHKLVKMVVQPQYIRSFPNPHYCQFEEGFFAVNSDKERIADLCAEHDPRVDIIRIHHYWFGDRHWFITNKLPRRKKWGLPITEDMFSSFIDSFNQVEDRSIFRFVGKLKTRVNK
jgi:hypothetical protein